MVSVNEHLLAVAGVRLAHMDRDALEVMDVHPLVRGDMDATMLLAELFLAKTGYAGPLCESSLVFVICV